MDSQIITGIIGILTVVLSGAINIGFWKIQKRADKKKNVAEIDNVDSETIRNLVDSIDNLQALHEKEQKKSTAMSKNNEALKKDLEKQAKQITMLEASYEVMVRQNEKLIRENEAMRKDITKLEKENTALRKLITDEQIKNGLDKDE